MRDGLQTVTELVDRIDTEDLVVEDVSLSRTEDDDVTVDISVRLSPCSSSADPVGDGGVSTARGSGERRGRRGAGSRRDPAEGAGPRVVAPEFGALSTRVGGPAAGTLADKLAAIPEAAAANGDATGGENAGSNGGSRESGAGGTSDDEPFTCRVEGCDESFASEHGMKIHATKAHQSADGSAPSPHRNPERLREVYEACDTFEEMTGALGVDVTPQTVRRSMMRLGVHDPESAAGPGGSGAAGADGSTTAAGETPAEAPTEAPAVASGDEPDAGGDGAPVEQDDDDLSGEVDALLPDAVDGGEFVAAVREASTLYEVQRRLDMEREAVQTLLAESGVLDLVHGRVATQGEREDGKAEIERRIVDHLGTPDDGDGADPAPDDGEEDPDGSADEPLGEQGGEQARAD